MFMHINATKAQLADQLCFIKINIEDEDVKFLVSIPDLLTTLVTSVESTFIKDVGVQFIVT